MEKASHLPVDRAQRGTGRGQDKIQSLRTYLQLPASPQLLKFLEPPQCSGTIGKPRILPIEELGLGGGFPVQTITGATSRFFVALGISCPLSPSCCLFQWKSIGNYNNQSECVHVCVFKIVEDIHRIKYFCSFFIDVRTRTVLWTFFLNRNVPSVHSYSNMRVLKNVYFDLFWVTSLVDPHLGPVCII